MQDVLQGGSRMLPIRHSALAQSEARVVGAGVPARAASGLRSRSLTRMINALLGMGRRAAARRGRDREA